MQIGIVACCNVILNDILRNIDAAEGHNTCQNKT